MIILPYRIQEPINRPWRNNPSRAGWKWKTRSFFFWIDFRKKPASLSKKYKHRSSRPLNPFDLAENSQEVSGWNGNVSSTNTRQLVKEAALRSEWIIAGGTTCKIFRNNSRLFRMTKNLLSWRRWWDPWRGNRAGPVWRIALNCGAIRAIWTIKPQLTNVREKADLCWN